MNYKVDVKRKKMKNIYKTVAFLRKWMYNKYIIKNKNYRRRYNIMMTREELVKALVEDELQHYDFNEEEVSWLTESFKKELERLGIEKVGCFKVVGDCDGDVVYDFGGYEYTPEGRYIAADGRYTTRYLYPISENDVDYSWIQWYPVDDDKKAE